MEQHAVPQDITGFKFKLVGDMTLKQFGELAGGAILAYLFYTSNWPAIFKWPLVIFCGFFGFALAFLPVEERPLDVWIVNFIKAIYQPTLYLWKKRPATEPVLDLPPLVRQPEPIEDPKIKTPPPPTESPLSVEDLLKMQDEKRVQLSEAKINLEKAVNETKADLYKTSQLKAMTVDELSQYRNEKNPNSQEEQIKNLLRQNAGLSAQIETVKTKIAGLTETDNSELQAQLEVLSSQREALEKQINALKNQALPAPSTPPPPAQVRVVDKSATRQTTLSLTEIPNIINGTVQNESGAPLDGTILIVKDKAGNSIRALKANKVGQFVASTPLENGTYYLEFEKEGHTFDILEITLSGEVMPPLEIIGKNGSS